MSWHLKVYFGISINPLTLEDKHSKFIVIKLPNIFNDSIVRHGQLNQNVLVKVFIIAHAKDSRDSPNSNSYPCVIFVWFLLITRQTFIGINNQVYWAHWVSFINYFLIKVYFETYCAGSILVSISSVRLRNSSTWQLEMHFVIGVGEIDLAKWISPSSLAK